jgi:conjugative transfer pilus assembly protein TraH
MKLRQLLISAALAMCINIPVFADVQGDLNGYFGSLGFDGNVSKAQAWQGQAAGYFTGGSVYLRNPVKQVQLISMQVPSLNAGCGGIDAYLGAFSMISGEEIQRFAKQIMSNAPGMLLTWPCRQWSRNSSRRKTFCRNWPVILTP